MNQGALNFCDQLNINVVETARGIAQDTSEYLQYAIDALVARVAPSGFLDPRLLEKNQHAAHSLAWIATYVGVLLRTADWADVLDRENRLDDLDRFMLVVIFGEYLQQLKNGIPMSQVETARPADLGLESRVT